MEGMMTGGDRVNKKIGRRVGILGGTFDPVHNGHLHLAGHVLNTLALDSILFIPSARPPHKGHGGISAFKHRVAMVKIAIGGSPRFFISEIEEGRQGPSYSIDTLEQLRGLLQPKVLPVFIIGMDAFAELNSWKSWRKLLDCTDLAVVPRPGFPLAMLERISAGLGSYSYDRTCRCWIDPAFGGKIYPLEMELMPISSTDIRNRAAAGESLADLVPEGVAEYIGKNRLYLK